MRKILRLIGSPCRETVFRDVDEFSDEVIKVLLMNWLYTKLTATKNQHCIVMNIVGCFLFYGLFSTAREHNIDKKALTTS